MMISLNSNQISQIALVDPALAAIIVLSVEWSDGFVHDVILPPEFVSLVTVILAKA